MGVDKPFSWRRCSVTVVDRSNSLILSQPTDHERFLRLGGMSNFHRLPRGAYLLFFSLRDGLSLSCRLLFIQGRSTYYQGLWFQILPTWTTNEFEFFCRWYTRKVHPWRHGEQTYFNPLTTRCLLGTGSTICHFVYRFHYVKCFWECACISSRESLQQRIDCPPLKANGRRNFKWDGR